MIAKKHQTDQEIPIHIVCKVPSEQVLAEERLAKQHGSVSHSLTAGRSYAAASLDLGLTITRNHNSAANSQQQLLTELQQRYEKEKQKTARIEPSEQHTDIVTQRVAEAEAYALTRNNSKKAEASSSNKGKTAQRNKENDNQDCDDNGGGNYNQEDDGDDDDDEKENVDTSGRTIFGFTTTRGKSVLNMMKRAISDHQRLEESSNTKITPKRKRGRASKVKSDQDEKQRLERKKELVKELELHEKKKKKTAQNTTTAIIDESEQESDGAHNDDEDDQPQRGSLLDEASGYERYFQDLHGSSKTSDNTLSKLPLLEPQEFQSILEAAPVKHAQQVATLTSHHEQHFPQWFFELHSGFNLLFYGYGSKRKLVNKFAMDVLSDGPVIVVNGFFPSITIKDIMHKILIGALEATTIPSTLQEQLTMVRGYFEDEERAYKRLYLVVHNLDGINLRNENAQSALASLAEAKNIHLVGTIDQINAVLLWDNVKSTRFNWIYHDATTFDNYLVETSFENSLLMRSSEIGGARGVQYVLASLTSNARGIFRVLAEYQLMEMEMNNLDRGSEQVGLPYHQYYEKCREQFFVSTETGMRSQLLEFKDHKVMVTKRLPDGTELFYMPLDKATLMGIVENMD